MLYLHYGCKVNQYETNAMMQQFATKGYEIVDFEEKADVYIINTCTVTNIADRKSRQMLRRVKQLNPQAILAACGCYAQVAKEELKRIPEIDLILGTNEKNQIVELVEKNRKVCEISDVMHQVEFLDFGTTTYTEKTRAVIKVQDGCDRFCSYCIIPYARGRVRSRKPEAVLAEIRQIAEKGVKEVVITGIHVASYGKDLDKPDGLISLLEAIQKIDGIERIRLGSLEPTLITEAFVKRLQKLDKICDQFHLSLQSGCDETLARMNRKYTTKEFMEGTERLKKAFPEVSLTTDIIVGFPGETDEEFAKTKEFLRKIDFYRMHIFKYSKRKGTKAASMPNQVAPEKQEERSKILRDLSRENEKKHQEKYLQKELEVLWEEKEEEYWKGHTKNYILVKMKSDENLTNQITKTKIRKNEIDYLIGE